MKEYELHVSASIYTALFNACANSPKKEEALEKTHLLYDTLQDMGYRMNRIHYECAIKAFGRCGDFPTALKLMDAMTTEGHPFTNRALNALLHGCVENKQLGFRNALLLWRKMRTKELRPSAHSYNLLLRTVRDCGVGENPEAGKELLQDVLTLDAGQSRRTDRLKKGQKQKKDRKSLLEGPKPDQSAPDQPGLHAIALADSLSINKPVAHFNPISSDLISTYDVENIVTVGLLDTPDKR
jgi:hypothetical protein